MGNYVVLFFVQVFNCICNNIDGREVCEGYQEDGDNIFSVWREGRGDFLQIYYCYEFVGNQFGCYDIFYLQCFIGWYVYYLCDWVEDVIQNVLEGDVVVELIGNCCEQCVQCCDQCDEVDQYCCDDNCYFKICQNVFVQYFEEILVFMQV